MFKNLFLLFTASLVMCTHTAQCQTLSESILARWQTYIFVSTEMPRSQLDALARDSLNTRTTLVFNGFGREGQAAIQKYVFQVNQSCCMGKASFAIDPVLNSKYKVTSVPTFLLAKGTSTLPTEFSMMSGDMQWANALKYWAQESKLAQIRQEATNLYSIYSR